MTGALGLAVAALALPTGSAFAAPSRSTLDGSRPGWAVGAARKEATPATDVVHARVYLPWRDAAGLDATTKALSTPGSASYGHYLTPAQFRQRYAPTQSDVKAVQQWLRRAGLSVVATPENNQYVAVEGTAAQAETAFGTTLAEYRTQGQVLRAPESAVTLPSALAGKVSAVVGLDEGADLIHADTTTGTKPAKQDHGAPGVGFRVGTPCSTSWGEKTVTTSFSAYGTTTKPIAPCGYTPAQVRGLYGLGTSDTGAGQTVAFVGANASPTIAADLTQYSRLHNLPDPQLSQDVPPGVYRHPTTPRQTPGDFYGEETLDAEAIHTTAPAARLLFVGSSNAGQDFDASISHIVNKHLASIISISYGFRGEDVPQGFVNSLNGTFAEAVATGIGVFVSSGDDGDDAIDFNGRTTVDFYANTPNVTAVGGTSAAIVAGSGGSVFPSGQKAAALPSTSSAAGGGLYGIDDPADPVNQPGWKRSFEVGWQTEQAAATGTLSPAATTARRYTFTGSLGAGAFTSGGGGGISRVFGQPSYQRGITDRAVDGSDPSLTGTKGRAVPDISALADPNTGFLVGQTQAFTNGTYYDEYRIGGTSLAAPLMAGMAAVANQHAGRDLGFLNPRIYAAYTQAAGTLYDVDEADLVSPDEYGTTPSVFRVNYTDSESAANGRTYSLRTLESPDQSLQSVRGYDTATGVGSPKDASFLRALATVDPVPYTPVR